MSHASQHHPTSPRAAMEGTHRHSITPHHYTRPILVLSLVRTGPVQTRSHTRVWVLRVVAGTSFSASHHFVPQKAYPKFAAEFHPGALRNLPARRRSRRPA